MKRYRKTTFSQYFLVAIILISIVAVGLLSFFVMTRVPFRDYFIIPWAAARVWLLTGGNPYGPSVVDFAAEAVEGSPLMANLPDDRVFVQPLISLLFYAPFSLIPYTISRVLWVILSVLFIGLIVLLSIKLSGWKLSIFSHVLIGLIFIFWLPGVDMILSGSLSPIIVGLVLLGIYLIVVGQDTTAGFILALTFSSFLTTGLVLIFILVWIISRKNWSVITSFISGVVFLILLSILALPSWFMEWASVLLVMNISLAWIQTPLMALSALLPGIAELLSILIHGGFIVYALALLITTLGKSGQIFIYKIFTFLIAAYLLNVRVSPTQILLVIPALILFMRYLSERWNSFGNLVSWGFLLAVAIGPWLIAYPELNFTQPLMMPLLLIGYPLLIMLGMIYIRWWALRLPKLPYESL